MWPTLCWHAASVGDTQQCMWAYSAQQHASKTSYRGSATCGTDSSPAQTGSFCAHCQTVGCQYCTASYQLLDCRCIFCDHANWHQHVPCRTPNAQGVLLELIALTVLSFFCWVPFCFCVFFCLSLFHVLLSSCVLFLLSHSIYCFFLSLVFLYF